jgi:hypothetical protein
MLLGAKRIETRSWYTPYRGELVIHAAKGFPTWARDACDEPPFRDVLRAHGLGASDLPRGVGICRVRLVACIPTEELYKLKAAGYTPTDEQRRLEAAFGDYEVGRYAWVTEFIAPIDPPRPARGKLGLWDWNDAVLAESSMVPA